MAYISTIPKKIETIIAQLKKRHPDYNWRIEAAISFDGYILSNEYKMIKFGKGANVLELSDKIVHKKGD